MAAELDQAERRKDMQWPSLVMDLWDNLDCAPDRVGVADGAPCGMILGRVDGEEVLRGSDRDAQATSDDEMVRSG